jgi:hypothetical protein
MSDYELTDEEDRELTEAAEVLFNFRDAMDIKGIKQTLWQVSHQAKKHLQSYCASLSHAKLREELALLSVCEDTTEGYGFNLSDKDIETILSFINGYYASLAPEELKHELDNIGKDLVWAVLNSDYMDKWMEVRDSSSPDLQGFLEIFESMIQKRVTEILSLVMAWKRVEDGRTEE